MKISIIDDEFSRYDANDFRLNSQCSSLSISFSLSMSLGHLFKSGQLSHIRVIGDYREETRNNRLKENCQHYRRNRKGGRWKDLINWYLYYYFFYFIINKIYFTMIIFIFTIKNPSSISLLNVIKSLCSLYAFLDNFHNWRPYYHGHYNLLVIKLFYNIFTKWPEYLIHFLLSSQYFTVVSYFSTCGILTVANTYGIVI